MTPEELCKGINESATTEPHKAPKEWIDFCKLPDVPEPLPDGTVILKMDVNNKPIGLCSYNSESKEWQDFPLPKPVDPLVAQMTAAALTGLVSLRDNYNYPISEIVIGHWVAEQSVKIGKATATLLRQ